MMFILLLCLFSLVAALPIMPIQRDVWVPPINSPTSSTVWVAGGTYTVTWDTSGQPSEVTNPNGLVYLRRGNETQAAPLVQGFPLTAGAVDVTIPADTEPDSDWMIVLFGDSGNWSNEFTILAS